MRKVKVFTSFKKENLEYTGTFLGFGVDYEEFDNFAGTYTALVVEMGDGSIKLEHPSSCTFIK